MNEEQSNTYRIDPALEKANVAAVANAHILAELGELEPPLKLVEEMSTEGTTITKIDVHVGKTIHQERVWAGTLTCVDRIELVAYTSDGRVEFRTRVCMAVQPPVEVEDGAEYPIYRVHVTPEARDNPACQGLLWDMLKSKRGLIFDLSISQIIVDNSQSNHSRNISRVSPSGQRSA